MLRKYYHATDYENLLSISDKGILSNNIENKVYLCDKPEYAARFMIFRIISKYVIIPVEVDDSNIEESFDHNEKFFGCKAYMYSGNIPIDCIDFSNILVCKK